jgi:hypothetical protein
MAARCVRDPRRDCRPKKISGKKKQKNGMFIHSFASSSRNEARAHTPVTMSPTCLAS